MTILLGLTGSVASTLYEKLIAEMWKVGPTNVILTPKAEHFIPKDGLNGVRIFRERQEWNWVRSTDAEPLITDKWQKDDPIIHIRLRDSASALVVAPCSANTLAKIANGIADNLLTSVARAWDFNRPFIIAPAMNTHMWEHPVTQEHIKKVMSWGCKVVPPQKKMLACGTEGMGALADIEYIRLALEESLRWYFPLATPVNVIEGTPLRCPGIPVKGHPGSFLHKRKHHTHTGVDLYCDDGDTVKAVESGTIVGIEDFTGVSQQTPWWEDTKCMLVEGATGVICYGEITPSWTLKVGDKVSRGQTIGHVKRVLKKGELKPHYPGHSESMLHMEIYPHGKYTAFEELGPNPDSFSILRDPTPHLLNAKYGPEVELKYEPKTT